MSNVNANGPDRENIYLKSSRVIG